MLPHFIHLTEKYYANSWYFKEDETIENKLEFLVCLYNDTARREISNMDESSLLFNGYLRQIILDVTSHDIKMKFHEYKFGCCSKWHLRYSNTIK